MLTSILCIKSLWFFLQKLNEIGQIKFQICTLNKASRFRNLSNRIINSTTQLPLHIKVEWPKDASSVNESSHSFVTIQNSNIYFLSFIPTNYAILGNPKRQTKGKGKKCGEWYNGLKLTLVWTFIVRITLCQLSFPYMVREVNAGQRKAYGGLRKAVTRSMWINVNRALMHIHGPSRRFNKEHMPYTYLRAHDLALRPHLIWGLIMPLLHDTWEWVALLVVVIYYASTIDKTITCCFFDDNK